MPTRIPDDQYADHIRQQYRERAARRRNRLQQAGKASLTVWLAAEVKTALESRATAQGLAPATLAGQLLTAALGQVSPNTGQDVSRETMADVSRETMRDVSRGTSTGVSREAEDAWEAVYREVDRLVGPGKAYPSCHALTAAWNRQKRLTPAGRPFRGDVLHKGYARWLARQGEAGSG